MWGCQKVAVIHRTILLSICTNIIFIGGWSWLSTVLLTCMQCGCDYVSCKMLFCLEIIRCFVFYVCLVHEGALFKPKQHHTSHWISYRLSYFASSSCDSKFVFGAWDLDSTTSAFTSAPEKSYYHQYSLYEGVLHLHREDRMLCGNAMKTISDVARIEISIVSLFGMLRKPQTCI